MTAASVFFLQAVAVVGLPFAMWRVARLDVVLPLVVVQVLVGIALGPTLFGRLYPSAWNAIFGAGHLPMLSGLQWLAVTLFCFLSGLHLRDMPLGAQFRHVLSISFAGIVVPLVLGTLLGFWLTGTVPGVVGTNSTTMGCALAIGLCSAVTALPVLAAILREMGLLTSRLGALALQCASVTDGAIWFLLTLVLLVTGRETGAHLILNVVGAIAYIGIMIWAVRPLLAHMGRQTTEQQGLPVLALIVVAGSALVAELVGLHHVVGGLLAGLVWPPRQTDAVRRQLEPLTVNVLMPFFFVAAGLSVEIRLDGSGAVLVFVSTLAVSVAGKMLGVVLAARRAGLARQEAWALGSMLQTKGMVELVVLGMLREAGVIGPAAFSGMLLAALASTVLARPLAASCLASSPQVAARRHGSSSVLD
ncbi:MAG: cation:proton antiporter [Dyella sp.]|nr:cation:proton antiporter [Dyella sp.]